MKKRRICNVFKLTMVIIGCAAAMIIAVFCFPKDFTCNINRMTGFSCSGCGITRMVRALLQGDVYQAFRYNGFIFLTTPVMTGLYGVGAYQYIHKGERCTWANKALLLYAMFLALFGNIRNIPMFHWLLPTVI